MSLFNNNTEINEKELNNKIKINNNEEPGNYSNIIQNDDSFVSKVIHIQDLERKIQPSMSILHKNMKIDKWMRITYKLHGSNSEERDKALDEYIEKNVYSYVDNGTDNNEVLFYSNNFLGAYLTAYNNHGDIVLVPDDIWIAIMLYLSKYINDNAEKLRDTFVKHDGQKKLVIKEFASSLEESLRLEKDWSFFFQEIIKLININTKNNVVDKLQCDFSTTDSIYKLVSTAAIMDSFKEYFSYGRMIMMCGINNVKFKGTRNDWTHLLDKLLSLKEYDVDGKLVKYVNHVEIILNQFINTYDNKVDVNFWNNIFTTEERRVGSGGQVQTYIDGWFINILGHYKRIDLDDIVNNEITVPIELINVFTGITKSLELKAGFTGVSREDDYYYRPQLGLIIYDTKK
mmetsp:Transcript_19383/g.17603  ORF Transcript_19383/g.17603 Transcript_19383/m.17603 type:complete len:401 (-) Transcript_19383:150-1352(-)